MAQEKTESADSRPLRGKSAVVTGGSRGIGLEIAKALAAQGCDVAITARTQAQLQAAAEEIRKCGVRVLAQPCDVRDPGAVAGFFGSVRQEFNRLDILVNNAGIAPAVANVQDLDVDTWREVMETNLTSMFLCTRAALPAMRRGGTIVNNLSVAAKGVFAGESAYCASKWGALGFTNTLRQEVAERGIRVIALMPGATNTDIWEQFWPEAPRENMMSPATIASVVVNAILLPEKVAVEELVIGPTTGAL